MREVYRATDTGLGRDVALEVMPAEMASSPERLERFRREAELAGALAAAHDKELLDRREDFGRIAEEFLGKWLEPDLDEQIMEGLRRAGLEPE